METLSLREIFLILPNPNLENDVSHIDIIMAKFHVEGDKVLTALELPSRCLVCAVSVPYIFVMNSVLSCQNDCSHALHCERQVSRKVIDANVFGKFLFFRVGECFPTPRRGVIRSPLKIGSVRLPPGIERPDIDLCASGNLRKGLVLVGSTQSCEDRLKTSGWRWCQ
jgi:hypothetical protein